MCIYMKFTIDTKTNILVNQTINGTIEFFEKISLERLERIKPKSVFFKFAFVEQL